MNRFSIILGFFAVILLSLTLADERSIGKEFPEAHEVDEWIIELPEGSDHKKVAEDHGCEHIGVMDFAGKNMHLFKKASFHNREVHPAVESSPSILRAEKTVARTVQRRVTFNDPLFNSQWHLHTLNVDVNVQEAWNKGYTGSNISIAVVDDGLELNHPDLQSNYFAQGSYDFNGNKQDPIPYSYDAHGTSAAGLSAAAANSFCGVGAAFKARIAGIRLIADAISDAKEGLGLSYRVDLNNIYTNSWGPTDDGRRLEGPGSYTSKAIEKGIKEGRGGKGSIYVWAAGNGRGSGDNCNYDGYANWRYTITIGAIDHRGFQTWYSESCSAMLAVTPSSGSGFAMVTTDLTGRSGSNLGDCTDNFGGTSAASPLAAGVIALILEANPNLTWRDVQGVIISSSKQVDSGNSDWKTNGGGLLFSHSYGFGLLDAGKAVSVAKTWKNLAPVVLVSSSSNSLMSIPTANASTSYFQVTDDVIVEHVEVFITTTGSSNRGYLSINLISPSSMVSRLQEPHKDSSSSIDWRYGSIAHWGESSKGKWSLKIQDTFPSGGNHNLVKWSLLIYGRPKK